MSRRCALPWANMLLPHSGQKLHDLLERQFVKVFRLDSAPTLVAPSKRKLTRRVLFRRVGVMQGRVSAEWSIHQHLAEDSPMAYKTNPLKMQLWKDRLAAFHASDEMVAVFCQNIPCSINSFYARKRRIETAPEDDTA